MNEYKMYDLIKRAQKKDNCALESIIEKMTPKIKKMLLEIPIQDRDDVEQQVKIKIIEAILKYPIESIPSIWSI
ncbi:helix-turn-helix domain-containing protein [Planotetraspora mira]|uniref:helix-turn-helix domain-containing protein n=1 Tax=Planotetraspora mira TaxID=58121 RepID=UPI00366CDF2A